MRISSEELQLMQMKIDAGKKVKSFNKQVGEKRKGRKPHKQVQEEIYDGIKRKNFYDDEFPHGLVFTLNF